MSDRGRGVVAVASGLLLWAASTGLSAEAEAVDLLAEVRLRGAILADTTVGGADETLAEWSDANSVEDSIHTRESGGELVSDASAGLLQGAIYSQTVVPGSFSRTSAFVQMYVQQVDTWRIGPGASGLSNGDPVKVRVQAYTSSIVVLEGVPSAVSEILFNVEGVPGITGRWVDWSVFGISPPQNLEFEEFWEVEVDTTVGASFTLTSNFDGLIGTSGFTGPMEEPERSDIAGLALVRVSHVKEFDTIDITADSGAPTTPIVLAPALSPVAMLTLFGVLASTGVMFLMARRRA